VGPAYQLEQTGPIGIEIWLVSLPPPEVEEPVLVELDPDVPEVEEPDVEAPEVDESEVAELPPSLFVSGFGRFEKRCSTEQAASAKTMKTKVRD